VSSILIGLKWMDFKRKYLTKYPDDILEKFWSAVEKLIPKLQDDEIITDDSVIVIDNELFVYRGESKWYMIRPATKNVWQGTNGDKNHLGEIIQLPRWEMAELLDVFTWMLGQPDRMKQA